MKRFVAARINFFDYNLVQTIIEAEDINAAYLQVFKEDFDEDFIPDSVEEMKQMFFDCDGMINIIEI